MAKLAHGIERAFLLLIKREIPDLCLWVRCHHTVEISNEILRIDKCANIFARNGLYRSNLAIERRQGEIVVPVVTLNDKRRDTIAMLGISNAIPDKGRRAPRFGVAVGGGCHAAIHNTDNRQRLHISGQWTIGFAASATQARTWRSWDR